MRKGGDGEEEDNGEDEGGGQVVFLCEGKGMYVYC